MRGVVFPEMHQFGFVERLYVHLHLPEITRLQNLDRQLAKLLPT
jgi:hypothetical protein